MKGLPGRYLLITGKVVSRAAQEKIYVKGRSGDRRSSGSELMRREDILLIAFGVVVIAIGLIAFTARPLIMKMEPCDRLDAIARVARPVVGWPT